MKTDPSVVRWPHLIACMVAMMAIANLQYAWTLFTTDLTKSLHANLDAIHEISIDRKQRRLSDHEKSEGPLDRVKIGVQTLSQVGCE